LSVESPRSQPPRLVLRDFRDTALSSKRPNYCSFFFVSSIVGGRSFPPLEVSLTALDSDFSVFFLTRFKPSLLAGFSPHRFPVSPFPLIKVAGQLSPIPRSKRHCNGLAPYLIAFWFSLPRWVASTSRRECLWFEGQVTVCSSALPMSFDTFRAPYLFQQLRRSWPAACCKYPYGLPKIEYGDCSLFFGS